MSKPSFKHRLSDVDKVILKAKKASIKSMFDASIRDRVVVTLLGDRLVVTLKKKTNKYIQF